MNTSPRKAILSVIMIGVLGGIGLTACDGRSRQDVFEDYTADRGTPNGATNIEIIDDAWYTFEYNDQCFLATRYWRHAALTKINCER